MQTRSIKTRQEITAAALNLFAENGYEVTSVAQICKAAGVSKGAFYHHFPSKQAVFQQALDEWLAGLNAQLDQVKETAVSVPEMLVGMTQMMSQIYAVAAGRLPMFLEFWRQAYHDPQMLEAVLSPYQRYREFFADLVEKGIAEGSIKETDPDTAARVVVSLAVGLLLGGVLETGDTNWAQVSQAGIQLLMNGLENRQ